ncbi:N-acetyltransferase [Panacibacter ginsenosidivorans]|uniref:N-acetyltransferase n=1 Tax=Panacibacter ginsenosidivorans TaxID=1813871 RepID=A0A5B8VFG3_9BACT|nr:acyltransferase [Panacibacter ginsenosidivorans]QEC69088.1 N-acetyltransferase [Panacibacter ginsenosidivorans]
MIHPLSDVQTKNIGDNTSIWQYCVVLKDAVIGSNCNINAHCFIENDVVVGNNVTLKCGVYLWNGTRIADDVFIGPNVTFVNNKRPRSKQHVQTPDTIIHRGASLGAAAVIGGGIEIGAYAMIGMGAVVTKNIPAHALVYGNPARIMGWVDEQGNALIKQEDDAWYSANGNKYRLTENGMEKL